MRCILIGGTPGSGKTVVSKKLGGLMNQRVVSLNDIAKEQGCLDDFDESRETMVINEDCLVEAILDLLDTEEDDLIIEGHCIDLIPSSDVKCAVVLRVHPDELRKRLYDRGYSESKVVENVEAEVIGVCQMDALDAFGEEKVKEIDTTGLGADEVALKVLKLLKGSSGDGRIDWMDLLEKEGILDDYMSD